MTDATQGAIAAQGYSAPAKPAAAGRSRYLFSPWFDFFTLGGGSLIICGVIALVLPKGIPSLQTGAVITILMLAINQPHFAHSYQMFYRNYRDKAFGATYPRALRWRYVFAGVVVPAVLLAFLAGAAVSGSARMLGYGANLMFFLVGWHYVKQGYGILIVDSVQKRLMFSDRAKLVLRTNGYAVWLVAWLALNHALRPDKYLGLSFFTLPIPEPIYYASIVFAAATLVAALYVMAQRWREMGSLPWNGVFAYFTTLYLWIVFVRINPLVLALVPTFHSLQYLAVVWRYQINASPKESAGFSLAGFIGLGMFIGFLGFIAVPRILDAVVPYDKQLFGPTMMVFCFYIFINVHHYFLDNVIWRRGNPDVQRHIFANTAPR